LVACLGLTASLASAAEKNPSTCFGTTDNGSLAEGWKLPLSGKNFSTYSHLGSTAGRTYVHSKVYHILLDAYQALEQEAPGKVFVYGETGWKTGGTFKPHKTHQNGLSVDFFVPVLNGEGESVPLPTNPLNKLGYNIEFVGAGNYGDYRIDYEAMAAHLFALKAAADAHGVKIWRVIFDNDLQRELFKTSRGLQLQKAMTFSIKKPWVRHDEHYHVDFALPCKALPTTAD
jgi:penicillin-insensitive murein endopeptidase